MDIEETQEIHLSPEDRERPPAPSCPQKPAKKETLKVAGEFTTRPRKRPAEPQKAEEKPGRQTPSEETEDRRKQSAGSNSAPGKRKVSKKAEQRRKARRRRSVFHVFLILVLIGALVYVGKQVLFKTKEEKNTESTKLSESDLSFFLGEEYHKIGKTEEKQEIADYEGYRVCYPVIGNTAVDTAVAGRAEDIISVFKQQVSTYRTDGSDRMTMVADYIIYKAGEEYVSVMFDIRTEVPSSDISGERIETYTYDLATGEEMTLYQMLTGQYLDYLDVTVDAFAKNYAASTGGSVIPNAVEAEERCYKYFMFDNSGLHIFYPEETLVTGSSGILCCSIPYADLEQYLAVSITGSGVEAVLKE